MRVVVCLYHTASLALGKWCQQYQMNLNLSQRKMARAECPCGAGVVRYWWLR